MRLEAQLSFAEQRARETVNELSRATEEAQFWKTEAERLKIQCDMESDSEKKARQQLRLLAEKLHQAGAQLQKLETWRATVVADQKDNGGKLIELSSHCESLSRSVEHAVRTKDKLETETQILNERCDEL